LALSDAPPPPPPMSTQITPRYKLMLFYDLTGVDAEDYYRFVMNEMVPGLQAQGLYIFRVFHTIPAQPANGQRMRQVEFVAERLETIQQALSSAAWGDFEAKLLKHAAHYSKKIVRFRQGFQM